MSWHKWNKWTRKKAIVVTGLWAVALGIWETAWLDAQTPPPPPDPVRINYAHAPITQATTTDELTPEAEEVPAAAAPTPEPEAAAPVSGATAATDTYYANCDEAGAAGASPIYADQPGYRSKLDRDGDGVAYE
jgi:Excalibur calcium-binding domain